MEELHVVLGANGSVGQLVVKELVRRGVPVRAVTRSQTMEDVDTMSANLLIKEQALEAIDGASHVYLCVGLPYRAALWKVQWPIVMYHVIVACEQVGAKLVFLDNIYMYQAPLKIPFNETQPVGPSSTKGLVRKVIQDMVLQAVQEQRIQAVIGRSADFYGPGAINSVLYISFLENLLQGKAPAILTPMDQPHTFGHVGDIAVALITLALDDTNNGEVFHLPVSRPVTLADVHASFLAHLNKDLPIKQISPRMQRVLGLFVKPIHEMQEMMYQFTSPYQMDDTKFRKRYPNVVVTTLEDGLVEMIQSFQTT